MSHRSRSGGASWVVSQSTRRRPVAVRRTLPEWGSPWVMTQLGAPVRTSLTSRSNSVSQSAMRAALAASRARAGQVVDGDEHRCAAHDGRPVVAAGAQRQVVDRAHVEAPAAAQARDQVRLRQARWPVPHIRASSLNGGKPGKSIRKRGAGVPQSRVARNRTFWRVQIGQMLVISETQSW